VLLVSHDLGEIRRSCDRVIWLQGGRIVADGPTSDVLAAYEAS
jgi:ABC-type polysaccharide/polyol phosphate transport system ATPase subunit